MDVIKGFYFNQGCGLGFDSIEDEILYNWSSPLEGPLMRYAQAVVSNEKSYNAVIAEKLKQMEGENKPSLPQGQLISSNLPLETTAVLKGGKKYWKDTIQLPKQLTGMKRETF